MSKYAVKRPLVAIPTFFGITVLVYLISAMAPGSPLEVLMTDPMATEESMEALKTQMGLSDPTIIRYFRWPGVMPQGNLGISCRNSLSVLGQVLEKLGPTLILTLLSTALPVLIAVPLGIMSVYKPYSAWDYASSGFAFVGASTPTSFIGLVMIHLSVVKLWVLSMGGMYDAGAHTVGSAVNHLIPPCLVLTIFNIGSILGQTRGSMMEVFSEDYIRTARAKDLVEPRVVIVHSLRNVLIPAVTVLSTMIPSMFGGAVMAERVSGWSEPGGLMVQSINVRDYLMTMGIAVVIAAAVLVDNILTDTAYSLLDPKIRESRQPLHWFVDNLTRWVACVVHKRLENSCDKGGKRMLETIAIKKDSYYRDVLKKFTAHKLAMIGVATIALEVFLVVFPPIILKLDPYTSDILAFSVKPGPGHLLGTDDTGRDMFVRLVYGGRVSPLVSLLSAITSLCIDAPLGLIAGYYKGIWEIIVMRVVDIFIPPLSMILVLVLVTAIGPSVWTVTLAIGVLGWTDFAKLIYDNVLSVREKEYVESAKAAGTKDLPLLMKYVVPNALVPILINFTFCTAQVIIQEPALSFLGMGVQPPQAFWGNILYVAQPITVLLPRSWFWVPSDILLVLMVTSINFVEDGIRDALDSKTKIKKE